MDGHKNFACTSRHHPGPGRRHDAPIINRICHPSSDSVSNLCLLELGYYNLVVECAMQARYIRIFQNYADKSWYIQKYGSVLEVERVVIRNSQHLSTTLKIMQFYKNTSPYTSFFKKGTISCS